MSILLGLIYAATITSSCFAASESKSSLLTVLQEAEENNPRLKAQEYEEKAAAENIRAKKSKYYPELNLAAIASTGNPGSFSMLEADGNLSSSQRVGYGTSLILKQDIWDFGRTSNGVHSAELEKDLEKKKNDLTRTQVASEVLATYIDCAFLRTQLENSGFIVEQARMLDNETDRFVRSGQKSVIERYLVDTEKKSAETRVAEFSERLRVAEERLGIQLQRNAADPVHCDDLASMQKDVTNMNEAAKSNPVIEAQKVRAQIAESKLSAAKSENMPRIFGMALVGNFENEHLKERDHYAAGVGISLPLFSGFLVDAETGKRDAELLAERSSVEAIKQSVDTANSNFDERIRSLQVRLRFLESESQHARKVFDLAHKRYENLQGSMNDLRESIKNRDRLILETDQTLRDLLYAEIEKDLFNGFQISKN
ncbi:MAG TPA: TolC family protein [Bdellovibrio sp.]|nr:TolC family protein [Bdellovibrio sp.]